MFIQGRQPLNNLTICIPLWEGTLIERRRRVWPLPQKPNNNKPATALLVLSATATHITSAIVPSVPIDPQNWHGTRLSMLVFRGERYRAGSVVKTAIGTLSVPSRIPLYGLRTLHNTSSHTCFGILGRLSPQHRIIDNRLKPTAMPALSELVQETQTTVVSDAGLTGPRRQQHQENNWNQNRKSLFITVTR